MCNAEEETLIHVLWECPAANDLWGDDASYVKKWTRSEVDFLELWEQLRCRLNKNQLEEVAVMLRKVWLKRNEWIFEKRWDCPRNSFIATRVALQEFQEVQAQAHQSWQKKAQQLLETWEKPERGFVKVNWNASLDVKRKRMEIGIIIRDEEGEALVAECDIKNNVVNAAVAESLALRKAADLCSDLNIQKAIFEGDAKEIVEAVLSEEEAVFDFSSIIDDVKFHFRKYDTLVYSIC
ncbi:hypothetical protein F2P56_024425 [Juglans regia]|uniref:RNase H type-1 domain-containing protein n=2 Tax=Juglans regia TaxID=51240 RepID=A0A833T8V3_JUGRE|nr:uncharacterized protein LOC109021333 [Juglans regia]KAF5454786.1 hypothetical protein F2P56_024425 [Juglans regia]